MDLGMFRWGKKGLRLWVIGPPVVTIALLLPVALHNRHVERDCDEREAILRQIPEMTRQVVRAREVLRGFVAPSDGKGAGDAAAEASQRIYRAAREHSITIRSLIAEENAAARKSGLTSLTVSVQGDGALPDLIAMFDDLHMPERLCSVKTVRLKAARSRAEQSSYAGEVVFQTCVASMKGED